MKTLILDIDLNSLKFSKDILFDSGVVAFPTETVYGLGALATDEIAVKKIFEIKGRPADNPLICHIHKDFNLEQLVIDDMPYAKKLRQTFLPGPLTMVYKSKGVVSNLVSCGLDSLAVRVPSHLGAQKFLQYIDAPIAAPSANISKHVSPVTSLHVYEDFNGKIPLILEGGACSGGIESTVLDVTTNTPIILRSGLITYEMIKDVVGKCEIATLKDGEKARSPGMKYKHYSPNCKTYMFKRNEIDKINTMYNNLINSGKKVYILCDDKMATKFADKNILSLGKNGLEASFNLYSKLREAEKITDILIGIELEDENGINAGVMNRMKKALATEL